MKSPGEMADFAEQCKELGYPAFKIHGWENGEPRREAATILAVRDRVGSDMDLMSDPYNALRTFGDAVKVGRACDERATSGTRTRWRTEAYRSSRTASCGKLLDTPMLLTEHVRGLEARVDFMVNGATDSFAATCSTWASPQR